MHNHRCRRHDDRRRTQGIIEKPADNRTSDHTGREATMETTMATTMMTTVMTTAMRTRQQTTRGKHRHRQNKNLLHRTNLLNQNELYHKHQDLLHDKRISFSSLIE